MSPAIPLPSVAASKFNSLISPTPQLWQGFEVSHGNEDTFREMLRIKRSVRDKYSTQSSFNVPPVDAAPTETVADPMAQLQKEVNFVRGKLRLLQYLHWLGVLRVYSFSWKLVQYSTSSRSFY